MPVTLHKNAQTTPAIRQEWRESTQSERESHLNRATVRQWQRRASGLDAAHRPHRIYATLRTVEEIVVVE